MTGLRDWTDEQAVADALGSQILGDPNASPDEFVVVHGDCPTGADAMAERWCQRNGVATERHAAKWKPDGPKGRTNYGAGFARNTEMVELGADICLAFWNGISARGERGAGTFDCFSKAARAGIPISITSVKKTAPIKRAA